MGNSFLICRSENVVTTIGFLALAQRAEPKKKEHNQKCNNLNNIVMNLLSKEIAISNILWL